VACLFFYNLYSHLYSLLKHTQKPYIHTLVSKIALNIWNGVQYNLPISKVHLEGGFTFLCARQNLPMGFTHHRKGQGKGYMNLNIGRSQGVGRGGFLVP